MKNKKQDIQNKAPVESIDTEYTEKENASIPIKSRSGLYVFGIFFLLVLLMGVGYYYFIYSSKPNYSDYNPNASITEKLNYNPAFLEQENLLIIKEQSTIEYLRTRLLYHKYESKGNPENNLIEELKQDFNGEKAQVLIDILKNYNKYLDLKKKIDEDLSLSEYKRLPKYRDLRVEIFGEVLESILFPEKPEDRIEKFFLYSKYYLKNHYEDDPISKKDHLGKARKEIYGDMYEDLVLKEPFPQRLELELGILEREMSILTEEERKIKIESIRDALRKGNL